MRKYLKQVRSVILVFLTHKIALPVLKHARKPNHFNWSELELSQMHAGTLGNDLYLFLEKSTMPGMI